MTTGTIGNLSTAQSSSLVGSAYYKSWTGVDGKYLPSGSLKWNSYEMRSLQRKRTGNVYQGRRFFWSYAGSAQGWVINSSPINVTCLTQLSLGDINPPTDWRSNDQLKLLDKLVKDVKDHDFNAGIYLAEMNKSSSMVASSLSKITGALISLKRGRWADAARHLGVRPRPTRLKTTDVSGRWLELQYGWVPLLADTFEAARSMEAITAGPRKQVFRRSHTVKRTIEGSSSPSYYSQMVNRTTRRTIYYEMEEELSFARQLGLLDPMSVAWELTPWSFVVDWFIPIGSYIDLLNTIPSLKGRFLTTTKVTAKFSGPPVWLGASKPPRFIVDVLTRVPDQNEVANGVRLRRTVSNSHPSVPLPTFSAKGAVHGKRVWNSIALAHQRLSKVFR